VAKEQIWWYLFYLTLCSGYNDNGEPCGFCFQAERFIAPEEFADTLYEFITKSGELSE